MPVDVFTSLSQYTSELRMLGFFIYHPVIKEFRAAAAFVYYIFQEKKSKNKAAQD